MSVAPVDFASLLCSRLCHDLLSPVGALNNGLELLADETDPEMRARCLDLLSDSAKASANKLKFFRLAFGAAGGFGDMVDPNEAKSVIEPMVTADGRTELGWNVGNENLPKVAIKILLNLALIASDALVRGGRLDIGAEQRDGITEIVIRAEGSKIIVDEEIRKTLSGGTAEADVTARTAAAWMVLDIVTSKGGEMQLSDASSPALLVGVVIPD